MIGSVAERPDRRRGWRIIAGLFAVLTVSSGFGFYNMSVYMNVLAETRSFSITSLSGAVSAFFVVGGIAGIWVARLLERYDVRWVMIGGATLAGAALAAAGQATSVTMIYLMFILFGIGNTGVSIVVSTTLVTRWFPGPNRSVALSIASTGLSMGGILVTPASVWVLQQAGVSAVLPGFGLAFIVLVVPIALLVIRDAPAVDPDSAASSNADDWQYAEARHSRFFYLVTAGYVLCMVSQVGGIAHLYNLAVSRSDFVVAATAIQALTLMSILARLAGGVLLTRIPTYGFVLVNLIGQAAGLGLLALAQTRFSILTGAALFGSSVGNLLMLHPLWLAEAFGAAAYPRLFSLSNAWTVVGVAGGPLLLGWLYDLYDYRAAYLTAVLTSILAAVLVAAAGRKPLRRVTGSI
jgi:MFS family permease